MAAVPIRAVFAGSGVWDAWRVETPDGEHLFTVRLLILAEQRPGAAVTFDSTRRLPTP